MMTAQPQADPSPSGYIVLVIIAAVIMYLFAVGQGKAPSPVDIGRLGMSRLRGHDDETAGHEDDVAPGVDTGPAMPKRPTDNDPERQEFTDPDGILIREPARRTVRVDTDRYRPGTRHQPPTGHGQDDDGDDLDIAPARTPRHERLRWLRDRHRPGDPIRGQFTRKTDFYRHAASILGVDEKTIRRDIDRLRQGTRSSSK
jgi:hypothetical protein